MDSVGTHMDQTMCCVPPTVSFGLILVGANACIVGRNVEKTEGMAKDIATARKGSKVIGIGAIDVRSMESLERAVATCVNELGGIDFLM